MLTTFGVIPQSFYKNPNPDQDKDLDQDFDISITFYT